MSGVWNYPEGDHCKFNCQPILHLIFYGISIFSIENEIIFVLRFGMGLSDDTRHCVIQVNGILDMLGEFCQNNNEAFSMNIRCLSQLCWIILDNNFVSI